MAHTKAKMGLTFVKLGLHPGMAGTHFLPMIAGPAVAAELLLTGRIIGAEEAMRMGIVSRVGREGSAKGRKALPFPCRFMAVKK